MNTFLVIGIGVGLATDAFAVAVAASATLKQVSPRQVFRFAFHFGLFQAGMPVMGWLAGQTVREHIQAWDHWVAFGLLLFLGLKAIRDALRPEKEMESERDDPTKGLSLVLFSLATSIDALAVGVSFAMVGVSIWYPSAMIGVVTAAMTTVGMVWGSRLGARYGKPLEIMGGVVLILIGVKILAQDLLA